MSNLISYYYNIFDDLDDSGSGWYEEPREVLGRSLNDVSAYVVNEIRVRAAKAGCYKLGDTVEYIVWHAPDVHATSGCIELEGEGLWRRDD